MGISPSLLFFFNDTATTEIYTLSLHDALPISRFSVRTSLYVVLGSRTESVVPPRGGLAIEIVPPTAQDRKSTRLNSSHTVISYAVFCLKKKKKDITNTESAMLRRSQTADARDR